MDKKNSSDRKCSNCELKFRSCTIWKNKEEKAVTGWDKNRAAAVCLQYKEIGGKYAIH